MTKNYPTKLCYLGPQDNLIFKSKFFYSKFRLSHGLVSFQITRTGFHNNFTHIQDTEKKHLKQNETEFLC